MSGVADMARKRELHGREREMVAGAIGAWSGRKATPELKKYDRQAGMPSYDEIRAKVAQEYKDAGFDPKNVWLQSFEIADIEYWIANEPDFGKQAVYLDNAYCDGSYGDQDGTENTRGCRGVFNDPIFYA